MLYILSPKRLQGVQGDIYSIMPLLSIRLHLLLLRPLLHTLLNVLFLPV